MLDEKGNMLIKGSLEGDVRAVYDSVALHYPSLMDRAPVTIASFVVYLVTQLSTKIPDKVRPSGSDIVKIESIKINIATLREVYRKAQEGNTLLAIVEGAGKGFLDYSKLKKL